MITFNYESEFNLENESVYSNWIARIIESEEYLIGEINYIFCDDEYLHAINVQYLNHDTLTDIISLCVNSHLFYSIFINFFNNKSYIANIYFFFIFWKSA